MQAGERAERKAQQLEAAVEDARQKLARAEQQLQAWRQGAEGERRTAAVLAALQSHGWIVLHDLHWPGRPYANIDHVAIGPTGVFVIDSKNWSGHVEVREGVLRQNGYSRRAECDGVAAATAAVAAFLEPAHRGLVNAVLCLVTHPTPASQPATARVVGLDELMATLTAGPHRINPVDVGRIGGYLRGMLDGSRSPEQRTTAVFSALGPAPVEPSAARRRQVRGATGARSLPAPRARVSKRGQGRVTGGRRVVLVSLQALMVAFATLYLAPRALQAIGDSFAPVPSSTSTVVTPSAPKQSTPLTHRHPSASARPTQR
jgi:hypothetical protein